MFTINEGKERKKDQSSDVYRKLSNQIMTVSLVASSGVTNADFHCD